MCWSQTTDGGAAVQMLMGPDNTELTLMLMVEAHANRTQLQIEGRVNDTKFNNAISAVYDFVAASPAARLALGADTDEVAEVLSGVISCRVHIIVTNCDISLQILTNSWEADLRYP